MSAAHALYQLPTCCDFCGAPVRLRPTKAQVDKWKDEPPDVLAHTYRCSWEISRGKKCNNIVSIHARDYQAATPVDTSTHLDVG